MSLLVPSSINLPSKPDNAGPILLRIKPEIFWLNETAIFGLSDHKKGYAGVRGVEIYSCSVLSIKTLNVSEWFPNVPE